MQLLKGIDANKDQSYFLWNIRTEQLPHILFPIGHLEKPEVRKLAQKFKLPNAEKKDSQGICFIGQVDMKEFLTHYIETKEGNVLNEKGEVIGTHPGALLFTMGERHGFTITKKTPNDAPYFVAGKDIVKNTITVKNGGTKADLRSPSDEKAQKILVRMDQVNWIGEIPKIGLRIQARTRYRQTLEEIIIKEIGDSSAVIEFNQSHEAITPGQSLVLYDRERCVGGGIIMN
jgi:tRNA-specific 2-thiouridylase